MADFQNRSKELHTARLLLRPFTEDDREAALDLLTNREVAKTYMLPDYEKREDALPLFERLRVLSEGTEHMVYAFDCDGRFAGFINDVCREGDTAEMGYVTAPAYQNRGFATEALSACIEELFRLGFTAVRAAYFEGNDASRRVMEKCGLSADGRFEKIVYRGKERTAVCMEIKKI